MIVISTLGWEVGSGHAWGLPEAVSVKEETEQTMGISEEFCTFIYQSWLNTNHVQSYTIQSCA